MSQAIKPSGTLGLLPKTRQTTGTNARNQLSQPIQHLAVGEFWQQCSCLQHTYLGGKDVLDVPFCTIVLGLLRLTAPLGTFSLLAHLPSQIIHAA